MITLSVVLVLASCRNKDNGNGEGIGGNKVLEGREIIKDYEFVYPQAVTVTDNNIIVSDDNDSCHLMVFPRAGNPQVSYTARKGMGPGEFINVRGMYYNPSSRILSVFDSQLKRLRFYGLGGDSVRIDNSTLLREIDYSKADIHDIFPLRNGIVTNSVSDGNMFAVIDSCGNFKYSFGKFPGDNTGIDDPESFFMKNQTLLAVDPKGNRFAAAGMMNDWLAFYKLGSDNAELITENFTTEAKVEVVKASKGNMFSMKYLPETCRYYTGLIPTEDYVYAIYRGITQKEIENGHSRPVNIMKYDWDGKLVARYTINSKMGSVAISPEGKELIAVVVGADGNPVLMSFDIDDSD